MDATERKILYYLFVSAAILAVIFIVFFQNLLKNYLRNIRLQKRVAAIEMQTLEKERHRIKTDLHDDLAPLVATTKKIVTHLGTINNNDPQLTTVATTNLDTLLDKLRAISHNLVPTALQHKGLIAAVHELVHQMQLSTSCSLFFSHPPNLQLPAEIQLHLYRIIKESVYNCIKHAMAEHCNIVISTTAKKLHLLVQDDGKGMQLSLTHKSGLNNMAFRTDLLNGQFHIRTAPGQGTTINIIIPLKQSSAYEETNNTHRSRRRRDLHGRSLTGT